MKDLRLHANSLEEAKRYIGRRVRVVEGNGYTKEQADKLGVGTVTNVIDGIDYPLNFFPATVSFDNGTTCGYYLIISADKEKSNLRLTRKPKKESENEEELYSDEENYDDSPDLEGTQDNNMSGMLQKLTTAIKIRLNSKYHTLYVAGFINGNLEFTERGHNALLNVLAAREDVLEPLTAEAEEFIAEIKKDEKKAAS